MEHASEVPVDDEESPNAQHLTVCEYTKSPELGSTVLKSGGSLLSVDAESSSAQQTEEVALESQSQVDRLIKLLFSTLPLKQRFQLKCLSKFWSEWDVKLPQTLLLVLERKNQSPCHMYELDPHTVGPVKQVLFPQRAVLVGSAKGLLLLRNADQLFIWNPLCEAYLELSFPLDDSQNFQVCYGFGWDESGYKIVRLSHRRLPAYLNGEISCHLYSFENKNWGRVETQSINEVGRIKYEEGVFFEGSVYWVVSLNSITHAICQYNIGSNSLRRIQPRPLLFGAILVVLMGNLFACEKMSNRMDDSFRLWFLNKDESWELLHTINKRIFGTDQVYRIYPLKLDENGIIIFAQHGSDDDPNDVAVKGELVRYNISNGNECLEVIQKFDNAARALLHTPTNAAVTHIAPTDVPSHEMIELSVPTLKKI